LRLDHERFAELVRKDPNIGISLSASLSRRLRAASQGIKESGAVIQRQLDRQLEPLTAATRIQILQTSLLEVAEPSALRALFGEAAPAIAGHLTPIGWIDGKPLPPLA